MHKDFKMGMLLGLVPVLAGIAWLASRPNLSTQRLHNRTKPEVNAANRVEPAPIPPEPQPVRRELPATDTGSGETTEEPDNKTANEQTEPAQQARYHVVQRNETLSQIAKSYYGSSSKWRTIYRANRSVISNPDKLKPGTRLLIPD